ncbi:MAG: M23 family metallopeptidase [Bacteroidota bacterium]|nr:M23 family metallopeptidase [Bacteroidota bacterium]
MFNKMVYRLILILFSLLFIVSNNVYSQTDNKNTFTSPLSIPLYSTGSFAELRGSHFHSGLDIRTFGKTGYYVYAPKEGYVSRIKVQAYGGGKNLYITHPNGYTTVYMHLERYCGEIEKFVKEYQYKNQVYEFDYTFQKPKIYVKQQDTIAITGESGAVAGPHLHFEIRKTTTENPINPLLFLDIQDTVAPYIEAIAITPLRGASVENSSNDKIINLLKNTSFRLGDTLSCLGKVFFSILAFDPSLNSSMKNGVLNYELYANEKKIFSHKINEFSFANYGFVDAVINYPLYIKTGKRYLSSQLLENGKLPYNSYSNNGIIEVKKDSVYKIEWKLSDIKNNTTSFYFYLIGSQNDSALKNQTLKPKVKRIKCLENSVYRASDSSSFVFTKDCLYQSIDLEHYERKGTYSNVHTLHNIFEPVKKKFTIRIKPYKIDNKLKDKYLVVKINNKGKISSLGGGLKNGFVETKVGDFGVFAVWIDTTTPQIKALNFKDKKQLSKNQKTLQVKISDNLSGVASYNAYLNGEWVLMEYDGKRAKLTYTIDEKLKKGSNTLKIVVKDKKNNTKTTTYNIIR